MNEYSKRDDTLMVCRIVESETSSGDVMMEYLAQLIDTVMISMAMNEGFKFYDRALNFQRQRMVDGKPDKTKVGPYQ